MALSGLPPASSLKVTTPATLPTASLPTSSASSLNLTDAPARSVLTPGGKGTLVARWAGTPSVSVVAAASSAAAFGGFGSLKGGTGLLERPTFDQSQFDPLPQLQEGGDIGRIADRKGLGSSDSYRVLLLDDLRHTERLVEKALPQVVPSISVIQARDIFHESRQNGVAVVIITVKEHAEFYSQMMVRKGLRSAIEPDTST